jgi:hypothetical protein
MLAPASKLNVPAKRSSRVIHRGSLSVDMPAQHS